METLENLRFKLEEPSSCQDAGLSSFLKITLLCGEAGGREGCDYL